MISQQEIVHYLKHVPVLKQSIRETLAALQENALDRAAQKAAADPALMHFLKKSVNSAAYGFRREIKAAPQIFSALGLQKAKELLYAYMVASLAPEQWRFFALEAHTFADFQLSLMRGWELVLKQTGTPETLRPVAALVPAAIAVADALFAEHREEADLIYQSTGEDMNAILKKMCGLDFLQLVERIAKSWEVDAQNRTALGVAFGAHPCRPSAECGALKMLHLLLFYELSRPAMMQAGVNAFIAFNPELVADVMDDFQNLMEQI